MVSQLLLLLMVTLEQVAVQLVLMLVSCPTPTLVETSGWPAHDRVIVLATVPPLYACRLTRRRGTRKVNDALVWPALLKLMLLVVNSPHRAASHQTLVPQSTRPVGY